MGKGIIDRLFGKKQIVVPTLEEDNLFNYMSLGKVFKLVDYIFYEKYRSEQMLSWSPFDMSLSYGSGLTYKNGLLEKTPPDFKYQSLDIEDRMLCNFGKIVWGFEEKTFIGGYMQGYKSLTLLRDYYRVMSLELKMVEALHCVLNNALSVYNPNIALLEIPEFSLKDCKISGM